MTPAERPGLSLDELASQLERVSASVTGDPGTRVVDVRQDSRRIGRGELFAARRGGRVDGREFVRQAVARGAAAVMANVGDELDAGGVPVLHVDDDQLAIALAAEALHHSPSRSVQVVALTGTNGKTTTASLTVAALGSTGARAARLGTLGYSFEGTSDDGNLTTPEADDISRSLAAARDAGATHLVLEASSIALTQKRVDGLEISVAAFSNLTQDHLDFHGSMERYAAAKERLFSELRPKHRVINVDDPFGAALADRQTAPVVRVGRGPNADVSPLTLVSTPSGIAGTVRVGTETVALDTTLVGEHNVDNLLLTLGIALALGVNLEQAARGLGEAPQVPGRLEVCSRPSDPFLVLVDYAHTPDALERVLKACRSLATGSVICVFGCGGDRDPKKRRPMGEIVGRGADRAFVTNDNPRSESPEAIAQEIEAGLGPTGTPFKRILDRASAIDAAVSLAQPGDVVLVAGKGHETYQLIGERKLGFDDRVQAKRALDRRARGEQAR